MNFVLRTPSPFELPIAVCGHGWYDLPPHRWDPNSHRYATVIDLGSVVVEGSLTESRAGLRGSLHAQRQLSPQQVAQARGVLRHILRLDEDLDPFWERCDREPKLRWVARRGGGRLLRSASLFEDLIKLLFTTNCSWAATRNMTGRLVSALGRPGRSGSRAFPSAEACAEHDQGFYREVVRAGYRAPHCLSLARGFASGELREDEFTDPDLPTDDLRARLLDLPGFGPYAAGQALRLLGRYDDLALDSWCRAKLARLGRRVKPPSDATVWRRYSRFGKYRGLALWMDLTADWHC